MILDRPSTPVKCPT
jgi:hypothetical protein